MIIIAALVLGVPWAAFAQAPQGERRSEPPAAAIQRSMCDKLAGAEQERCLAEQQQAQQREREALGPQEKRRTCDELFGPEKELCLKKGGTVKAGTSAVHEPR